MSIDVSRTFGNYVSQQEEEMFSLLRRILNLPTIFEEEEHNGIVETKIESGTILVDFKFPCATLECEGTIWGINVPCGFISLKALNSFFVFIDSIASPIDCRRCGIDSMDLEVLNNILKKEVSDFLESHQINANPIERPK